MEYVSGEILIKNGFQKGYIGFSKNKILEIGKGTCPKKPIVKGLIIPSLVNAHTHIGDSFIGKKKEKLPKDIKKLVAPPNGLKHKMLSQVSEKELINGMENSINSMIKSGTNIFCDFRENGIIGICQLKTALNLWKISSVILSRPDSLNYFKKEMDILLKNSDGIGLSAISDWDFIDLQKISKHVKKEKKLFAFHASELFREDIDQILDLKPDFLIHMIKASESDIIRVKENNIPIILCPRSNYFFGFKPKYETLKKNNVDVIFGTDNAMLNSPSMLEELKYILQTTNVFSKEELLLNSTYLARKALNLKCDILGPNSKIDFIVLDKKNMMPLFVS